MRPDEGRVRVLALGPGREGQTQPGDEISTEGCGTCHWLRGQSSTDNVADSDGHVTSVQNIHQISES